MRHADIERELIAANKLRQMLALALLDDAARGGDVASVIRQRYGQAAVKAFERAGRNPRALSGRIWPVRSGNRSDGERDPA